MCVFRKAHSANVHNLTSKSKPYLPSVSKYLYIFSSHTVSNDDDETKKWGEKENKWNEEIYLQGSKGKFSICLFDEKCAYVNCCQAWL